jgi:CheY-like chemotaxis protein
MTTILLVEHRPALHKSYLETLQQVGYQVRSVMTTYHARQLLQSQTQFAVCVASIVGGDELLMLRDLSTIRRKYGIPTLVLLAESEQPATLCQQLGLKMAPPEPSPAELVRFVHEMVGTTIAARLNLKMTDPEETKPAQNQVPR